MIGHTISHYKILEKLGEGGMGVVYKAEDLKLKRTVAIKFLPHSLSAQTEERERFALEAQAASALSHPNVATIYEIDEADGESFIVMEYVEGQTLREVRAKLTLKQAVDVGIQVAEGIAAAHEKGIIHRDIKSDNIMVRKDGRAQVMDFGLAKLRGVSRLTKAGSTVGTMAYMSPEQVQGLETDHRTDIFSLGVVLYELLTGQLPFKGEHEAALMYEVLNVEPPPPSSVRQHIEAELERIILKCLEKDREERYQSVKDVAVDLKRFKRDSEGRRIPRAAISPAGAKVPEVLSSVAEMPRRIARAKWIAIGLGATVLLLIIALVFTLTTTKVAPPVIVSTHPLTSLPGLEDAPTWSPDGTRLAYGSNESGNPDVWVQQVAVGQKLNLTKVHSGGDWAPSWSPDGEWIAFISDREGGGIYVMPALGGSARPLYRASPSIGLPTNVHWSPDGTLLGFGAGRDLYIIPSVGGTPSRIPLDTTSFGFRTAPAWSPDGKLIAYTEIAGSGVTTSRVWTSRIDGSDRTAITDGKTFDRQPVWSRDGQSLFVVSDRGGNPDAWWIPVDSRGRAAELPRALTVGAGVGAIALSFDGRKLAYSKTIERSNIWSMPITRRGILTLKDATPLTSENYLIEGIDLSSDGEWIAYDSNRSGNDDIWIMRKNGRELRQVTTDKAHDWSPCWSPDGKEIAFHSVRSGNREIYAVPVEGGPPRQLTDHPAKDWIPIWSPTGEEISFTSDRTGTLNPWSVSSSGGEARMLASGKNFGSFALWSPDGKQIVIDADRYGRRDLFLVPREGGEPKELTRMGWSSIFARYWSRDGKTIYAFGARELSGENANIWAISVPDGLARRITDLQDSPLALTDLTSDGEQFFLVLGEIVGDVWVAELATSE